MSIKRRKNENENYSSKDQGVTEIVDSNGKKYYDMDLLYKYGFFDKAVILTINGDTLKTENPLRLSESSSKYNLLFTSHEMEIRIHCDSHDSVFVKFPLHNKKYTLDELKTESNQYRFRDEFLDSLRVGDVYKVNLIDKNKDIALYNNIAILCDKSSERISLVGLTDKNDKRTTAFMITAETIANSTYFEIERVYRGSSEATWGGKKYEMYMEKRIQTCERT